MTKDPRAIAGQSILLVDDSDIFRERLALALEDRGFDVLTAADAVEAMEIVESRKVDLAVIDLKMPGPSGMTLLRDLRINDPDIKVVVLTGFGSIATAVEAMRLGAVNFVSKPADADDVLAAFSIDEPGVEPEASDEVVEAPSLARAEWEHIQRVLADCGGNVSEAARRLGLHRRSLQRKLKKMAP
ncbi:MAG: two-component system response regulator [Planctomycetes bacterium SCN 63-9]|nr:MAG: two-component system response regulator [Planctomycetes bacterium SCN 63-9]